MLSIRLSRVGKKNEPKYRLIVLDKRKDPFGDYIELLGHYDPKGKQVSINADRVKYWLSQGAQPTLTVHNMLVKQHILADTPKRIKVRPSKLKKEGEEASQ